MGDQYEPIPAGVSVPIPSAPSPPKQPPMAAPSPFFEPPPMPPSATPPPPGFSPYPPPATPPGPPPGAQPASPFPANAIPPAPSERIGCCDAKTMVLVSASLLLTCELVTVFWNSSVSKDIPMAIICGLSATICLLLYINAFGLRSAPFHIVMGTLMLMIILAKVGYGAFTMYGPYTGDCGDTMKKRPPPFESCLLSVVIVIGLVQMYRVQNFKDSYGALLEPPKPPKAGGRNGKADPPSDPEAGKTGRSSVKSKKSGVGLLGGNSGGGKKKGKKKNKKKPVE